MEADKGSRDKDELFSKWCLSPVTGEPEPMEHRGLRLGGAHKMMAGIKANCLWMGQYQAV